MEFVGKTMRKDGDDVAVRPDIPTKLSQLENDIGAGGGIKIIVSATEPAGMVVGDWWYEEV